MGKRRGRTKMEDGASIAEHARRLRDRPGWNPDAVLAGRGQELEHELSALRQQETAVESESCDACESVRIETGDPTALCRHHLALAMGLTPEM
jgi:hypothetical protein